MKLTLPLLFCLSLFSASTFGQNYLNQSRSMENNIQVKSKVAKLEKRLELNQEQKQQLLVFFAEKQTAYSVSKKNGKKNSLEEKKAFQKQFREILTHKQLNKYYSKESKVEARNKVNNQVAELLEYFKLTKEHVIAFRKELFRSEYQISLVVNAYPYDYELRKPIVKKLKKDKESLLVVLERICVDVDPHSLKRTVSYGKNRARKLSEQLSLSAEKAKLLELIECERYSRLQYLPLDNLGKLGRISADYWNCLRKDFSPTEITKIKTPYFKRIAKSKAMRDINKKKYRRLSPELKKNMYSLIFKKYFQYERIRLLFPYAKKAKKRRALMAKTNSKFLEKEILLMSQHKEEKKSAKPYSYTW